MCSHEHGTWWVCLGQLEASSKTKIFKKLKSFCLDNIASKTYPHVTLLSDLSHVILLSDISNFFPIGLDIIMSDD